jgi:hypothetical protein
MKAGVLMAGFGRSDITPRPGVALSGFGPWLNRNSTAVLQPLLARCAVLRQDDEPVVILSLELIGLSRELESVVRDRVSQHCQIDPDRLLISCTHTHSGPQTNSHIGWGHPDDLYLETLPGRILPAVEEALADQSLVSVRYANPPCEGIAINRDRDAAYDRSMPVDERLAPDWRPARPELTDTRCHVLSFHKGDQLVGMIHSFGCHPVVCCERCTRIHGDFPGLACTSLESAHPGLTALFLPGALGDVNPAISHRPEAESLAALDVISRRYAAALEAGLETAREIDPIVLKTAIRDVVLPRVDWSREHVETRIDELERRLHGPGLTDDPLAGGDNPLERTGIDMVRLAGLRRLRERLNRGEPVHPSSRLHGLRIGPVRLLGAPLEIFQMTQQAIVDGLPGGPVIVLSHVNGSEGYAPDPELYRKSNYAAEFVTLMAGDLPHACIHDELVRELVAVGRSL